jgi:hypothetical protein
MRLVARRSGSAAAALMAGRRGFLRHQEPEEISAGEEGSSACWEKNTGRMIAECVGSSRIRNTELLSAARLTLLVFIVGLVEILAPSPVAKRHSHWTWALA